VITTGFAGGRTGTTILEELSDEGILNDFVRVHDDSRVSTAVIDPMSGGQTEINEVGPSIGPDEIEVLFSKLRYLSKGADCLVLAGSLPRDVPDDLYARILKELRAPNVITAVDAFGACLRTSLSGEPDIVSPNRREAEELVGYEFQDDADVAEGAEEIHQMGAGIVLIHDREGCVARVPDGKSRRLLRAHLPRIADVAATVGSGDAFLAGFIASWIHTREPEAALRLAVATGAANALQLGAGVFDQEDVDAFSRRVEIEELTV
jgi:1-phosphofructokinase/tagatose 6-phosphate kinase